MSVSLFPEVAELTELSDETSELKKILRCADLFIKEYASYTYIR